MSPIKAELLKTLETSPEGAIEPEIIGELDLVLTHINARIVATQPDYCDRL